MEQISGRLRENDEYHNIFRNTMVHIYSTNQSVLSQAEFDAEMKRKEDAAVRLLSLQEKADEKELNALIKRVNIENDILSIENGRLVRNELKKMAFIRKQKIAFICSVDGEGFPNVKAMLKPRKAEGLRFFWFSTNISSMRVKQYLENPKACVYFCHKGLVRYAGVNCIS